LSNPSEHVSSHIFTLPFKLAQVKEMFSDRLKDYFSSMQMWAIEEYLKVRPENSLLLVSGIGCVALIGEISSGAGAVSA
jgi:hypothetical protein